MKTTFNKVVALCVGGIDAQYQSIIIDNVSKKCEKSGIKVLLFQAFSNSYEGGSHNTGDFNIFNLINYNLIDAVIISTLSIKYPKSIRDIIERAKIHQLPIISIDGYIEGSFNVLLGYNNAITELTNHVIEKHNVTKINFMAASKDNEISNEREMAYRKTLKQHGIPVEEHRILYGYFWSEHAMKIVLEYFEKYHEMPEAFVCANDSMAIGVCQALDRLGFQVPNDVIVTGLDGILEAVNYYPRITTARFNLKGASEKAVDVLIDYFNGNIQECIGEFTVESELVFAGSCGCELASHSTNNQLKRDLYASIDFNNSFSQNLIRLIEHSTGASSLNEIISRLNHYILKIWSYKVWFCIKESYLKTYETYSSSFINSNAEYQKDMNCVIYREGQSTTSLGIFNSLEMLPNLNQEVKDYSCSIMFNPLHYQDETIGYVAITYEDDFHDGLFKYSSLLMNIAIILQNTKIQQELKYTVNKLENMYIRDSMTGIYNRRGFYQCIQSVINKCIMEDKYIMIISVDLDGLKPINDIYGHNEGDNAIITVAKTLSSIAITNEIVARFGGDEYVVSGVCDSEKYAKNYVNRLNDCLKYYNDNSGKPYKIQASCGIYCTKFSSNMNIHVDDLIKIADEFMYKEKQSHKYDRRR